VVKKTVWTEEHFDVMPSTIKHGGNGLFSKINLKQGDTIGEYTGKILTDDQANSEPYVDSEYILWVCADYNILGEGTLANHTRFINHSNKPNSRIVTSTRWKKARIEVIEQIKVGEEIFIDYGPDYWEARKYNESIDVS
jgi:SET domain-containing protein